MLGDISVVDDIYIVCGYTDMRKQIDGLCSIVKDQLHMDPQQRAPFYWGFSQSYGTIKVSKKGVLYHGFRQK